MAKDVTLQLNDIVEQRTPENENSENKNPYFQLGKTCLSTTLTALQWISWWTGALAINTVLGALPGAIMGVACGYAYACWSEPCIEEKNSLAVRKCALRSPDLGYGALYGAASMGLIGTTITIIGLFKNPSIKSAKHSLKVTAKGIGTCCALMGSVAYSNG